MDFINKINENIKLISFFNKKENKLKLDLEKLLINYKSHDITDLLFKLKMKIIMILLKKKKMKNKKNIKIFRTFDKILLK